MDEISPSHRQGHKQQQIDRNDDLRCCYLHIHLSRVGFREAANNTKPEVSPLDMIKATYFFWHHWWGKESKKNKQSYGSIQANIQKLLLQRYCEAAPVRFSSWLWRRARKHLTRSHLFGWWESCSHVSHSMPAALPVTSPDSFVEMVSQRWRIFQNFVCWEFCCPEQCYDLLGWPKGTSEALVKSWEYPASPR